MNFNVSKPISPEKNNNDGGDNLRRRTYGEIEEILDRVETEFMKFDNFGVLESPPSDHHFQISSFSCTVLGQLCKRSLMKKMTEEWKAMEAKLPSSIYARVYAKTKDVMRVAIVAEKSSSYHHGLFFFDVRFPTNYPLKPPQFFHHSFGESQCREIFPKKQKKEFPIMETLVSLQQSAMASVGGNPSFEEQKAAMEACCSAVLGMLRSPPEGFEGFVAGYFRTRAHRILSNYRACVEKSGDVDIKVSFFRLVRVFEKNGSYCRHHYDKEQYDQALACEASYNKKTFNCG